MELPDESDNDQADSLAGMGLVFWILFACGIFFILLFLCIPW